MDKNQAIESLFELFYLDSRASQTELEIAYETLTSKSDMPNCVRSDYRNAFETLMIEWFGVGKKQTELTDVIENVKTEQYPTDIKNIISVLPEKVKEGFDGICASTKEELADEVKKKILEQGVYLPLFFWALKKYNRKNWLGETYWSKEDMLNIVNACQLNDVDFRNISFSIYYGNEDYSWKYKDLKRWVRNQQQLFKGYGELCPRFDVLDIEKGCTCTVTIEHELGKRLVNLLQTYSLQLDLNFCASGDIQVNQDS